MTDANYVEYPITMAHPHYVAAKLEPVIGSEIYGGNGQVVRRDIRGTPEKYPPVTVSTEREEEYYTSQGYERAGKIDPSAWVVAHSSAPPEEYKPAKYPMWRDGQLIMTAQEDPLATEEDLRVYPAEEVVSPPTPNLAETENARLRSERELWQQQLAAMNEQMQKMQAQMEAQAIAATVTAQAQAPNPIDPQAHTNAPSESQRPLSPGVSAQAPKTKRPYTRKAKA